MPLMLGSFADGMFGAAKSVASLYGMYQGLQQTQSQLDAADAVKGAMSADQQGQQGGDNSQRIDTTVPANGASTAPDTTTSTGPVADPSKLSRQPDSQGAPGMAPDLRARIQREADREGATPVPDGDLEGRRALGASKATKAPDDSVNTQGALTAAAKAITAAPSRQVPGVAPVSTAPSNMPTYDVPPGGYVPRVANAAPATQALTPGQPLPVWRGLPQADPNPNPPPAQMAQPAQPAAPAQPAIASGRPLPGQPAPNMAAAAPGQPAPDQPAAAPPAATPSAASGQPASAQPTTPGAPQLRPAGDAGPFTDATPSPAAPGLGARILGAINPMGSAQAAEPAPGQTPSSPGATTVGAKPSSALPQPTPAQAADNRAAAQPQQVAAQQATQQPAPQAGPTAVTVPAQAAPVAPNQASPTLQSEPTPQVIKPSLDPRPYAALAEQAPQYRALVDKIAAEESVSPDRLAGHWYQESRLHTTAPTGKAGEIGVMQMLPGTRDMVDPKHQLDPTKMEDSLRLGARYINLMDREFGRDSPSSVAAYQGGPGTADAIARDPTNALRNHPTTMDYTSKMFGNANLGTQNFTSGQPLDARGLVNAGVQGGPDGFIRYLAQNGPKGMQLTDKWQQAETALMVAAASRGDYAGMQHAREFVLQMSQQGSMQSLMAADKALIAGDGVTAAQYLAKAHAFFPDSTMGRFGVDKSGNVWAQRVDEHDPSRALGDPFQVTHQGLAPMLIQTRDPEKYLQMVTQQQQAASAMRFQAQHGAYYADMINARKDSTYLQYVAHEDAVNQRADASAAAVEQRREANENTNNTRQDIAETNRVARAGQHAQLARQVDTEAGKLFTDVTMPEATAAQRGTAARIYSDIRMNAAPGTAPPPHAQEIAAGLVGGSYQVMPAKDGSWMVFDPKDPKRQPKAYLSPSMGAHIAGGMQQQPRQGVPTSPVGSGAGTPMAIASGMTPSLAGMQPAQSSAIPMGAPPGATVH